MEPIKFNIDDSFSLNFLGHDGEYLPNSYWSICPNGFKMVKYLDGGGTSYGILVQKIDTGEMMVLKTPKDPDSWLAANMPRRLLHAHNFIKHYDGYIQIPKLIGYADNSPDRDICGFALEEFAKGEKYIKFDWRHSDKLASGFAHLFARMHFPTCDMENAAEKLPSTDAKYKIDYISSKLKFKIKSPVADQFIKIIMRDCAGVIYNDMIFEYNLLVYGDRFTLIDMESLKQIKDPTARYDDFVSIFRYGDVSDDFKIKVISEYVEILR